MPKEGPYLLKLKKIHFSQKLILNILFLIKLNLKMKEDQFI